MNQQRRHRNKGKCEAKQHRVSRLPGLKCSLINRYGLLQTSASGSPNRISRRARYLVLRSKSARAALEDRATLPAVVTVSGRVRKPAARETPAGEALARPARPSYGRIRIEHILGAGPTSEPSWPNSTPTSSMHKNPPRSLGYLWACVVVALRFALERHEQNKAAELTSIFRSAANEKHRGWLP
jgi:hypothetical protein